MKKSLVITLALVFVLGIAGTAFAAANPFVDVPAKHWAYEAVSKLAKAGIVDGYGDGTFRGDKNMTRYEMAQIVAKAMARSDKADAELKATIDKLAVEFANELNNLGVRVGNLEKKVGTVKITGDARVRWVDSNADLTKAQDGVFQQRFRLNLMADINENTSFYGRFVEMDHNEFGTHKADTHAITDAALTSKNLFGKSMSATVGRFSQALGQTGYYMDTTGLVDGAKVDFGSKVKTTIGFANFSNVGDIASGITGLVIDRKHHGHWHNVVDYTRSSSVEDALFAQVSYDTSKATNVKAFYFKEMTGDNSDRTAWSVGAKSKFHKDFAVYGDYVKETEYRPYFADEDPTFWVVGVAYKGNSPALPKSYGLKLEYVNNETGAALGGNYTGAMFPLTQKWDFDFGRCRWDGTVTGVNGVKGLVGIFSYTLAKNITFDYIGSINLEGQETGESLNYNRFQINYLF